MNAVSSDSRREGENATLGGLANSEVKHGDAHARRVWYARWVRHQHGGRTLIGRSRTVGHCKVRLIVASRKKVRELVGRSLTAAVKKIPKQSRLTKTTSNSIRTWTVFEEAKTRALTCPIYAKRTAITRQQLLL